MAMKEKMGLFYFSNTTYLLPCDDLIFRIITEYTNTWKVRKEKNCSLINLRWNIFVVIINARSDGQSDNY